MFLSCWSPCWCGSVWVAVLADGVPLCRFFDCGRLIHLFTDGCGCTFKLVLCLLCGWVLPCVVRAIAGHLYCWSEFFPMRVLALPRAYCVICTMYVAACSVRVLVYSALLLPLLVGCVLVGKSLSVVLSWGGSLSFCRLGGVLLGLGSWIIFMAFGVSAGHQRFCWGLCWNRHLSGCCWRILCK